MLTFTIFVCATLVKISGADWCYESQHACNSKCTEPDKWAVVSEQCNGKFQSPINIVTRKSLRDERRLSPLQFTGYQDMFHGVIKNNGHNVEVLPDIPVAAMIKGGNLPATYKAMQLHLHWGSEHTIDGERFPMEMHIVHVKEEYSSIPEALGDRTGVAVLGFFFQESESSNKKYDPIIAALEDIKHPTANTTLRGVSLDMLLPPERDSRTRYFRYQGSLTTPNCDEAIIWTVFENPIRLSRNQIAAFSQLQFPNGMQMTEIYRPVQPLNGRKVYYSEGHVTSVSSTLLSASILATIGYSLHIQS